mgnify:CR=1 FL=1
MKNNAKSILLTLMEWLVLIAPTSGYAIYCYEDILQYTMTSQSKGCSSILTPSCIAISILSATRSTISVLSASVSLLYFLAFTPAIALTIALIMIVIIEKEDGAVNNRYYLQRELTFSEHKSD